MRLLACRMKRRRRPEATCQNRVKQQMGKLSTMCYLAAFLAASREREICLFLPSFIVRLRHHLVASGRERRVEDNRERQSSHVVVGR